MGNFIKEGDFIKKTREAFEENQKRYANDPAAKARRRPLYAIIALYFLIFLVPDSVWLNIGLALPNEANIPDFVLKKMEHSSFPVSVFVFFVAAPFFFVISLFYILIAMMSPGGYKGFLFLREQEITGRGKWGHVLALVIAYLIIIPWMAWRDPDFISPSTSAFSSTLKPFENKLWFFGLFGSSIIGFMPLAIATLCAEMRFRFTTLINKEI